MRQYFRATLDFRWGEMDKDKVPEGERAISQFFKEKKKDKESCHRNHKKDAPACQEKQGTSDRID